MKAEEAHLRFPSAGVISRRSTSSTKPNCFGIDSNPICPVFDSFFLGSGEVFHDLKELLYVRVAILRFPSKVAL